MYPSYFIFIHILYSFEFSFKTLLWHTGLRYSDFLEIIYRTSSIYSSASDFSSSIWTNVLIAASPQITQNKLRPLSNYKHKTSLFLWFPAWTHCTCRQKQEKECQIHRLHCIMQYHPTPAKGDTVHALVITAFVTASEVGTNSANHCNSI